MTATAVFTNVGLDQLATALQSSGAQTNITYVAVGLGAGTLSSALTNGSTYTSLSLNLPLVNSIASGQSLTLVDSSGDLQNITATGTNSPGSSTITVNSFIAAANFGIGSGVVNTPAATDTMLQNETYRVVAITGSAGSNPGESLNPAYFDPTTPSGVYIEVGYFAGSTATSGLGTGILMCRDIQFWNHTLNADSSLYQMDSTI